MVYVKSFFLGKSFTAYPKLVFRDELKSVMLSKICKRNIYIIPYINTVNQPNAEFGNVANFFYVWFFHSIGCKTNLGFAKTSSLSTIAYIPINLSPAKMDTIFPASNSIFLTKSLFEMGFPLNNFFALSSLTKIAG